MYAKILLLAAIIISSQVYAQGTAELKETNAKEPSISTAKKVANYIKEKFSASYHGEYYIQRRLPFFEDATTDEQKRIQDLHILHNPTVIYKPTDNWQMLATGEFKYTDRPGYGLFPNTFYRSLFTLTRKNILTEDLNGFKLEAGVGRRQFNTGIAAISVYGNNRIFTTISKTLNKHSGSLFLQYIRNDFKKASPAMWKDGIEAIPTINFQLSEKLTWTINDDMTIYFPYENSTARKYYITHDVNIGYFNYQWNDKLSTYYQLKYLHLRYDFTKDYRSDLESIEHYAGVLYSFTKKLSLALETGSEIARASDNESFLSKKITYPEFTIYLDIAL